MSERFDPKGILFDYGNTLLRYADHSTSGTLKRNLKAIKENLSKNSCFTSSAQLDKFIETFQDVYLSAEKKISKDLKEIPMISVFTRTAEKCGLKIPGEKLHGIYAELYRNTIGRSIDPEPDALKLLKTLRERGIKAGIISNSMYDENFHLEELDRFGFSRYLDCAIFSAVTGYRKPHPEIFNRGTKEIGLPVETLLFVGDHLVSDIEGAHRAGMRTCLKKVVKNEGKTDVVPDYTITELSGILKII